jgi:hypothetical protein
MKPGGSLNVQSGDAEMNRKPPVTRAELELAVRAELVDVETTTGHAKMAAHYILAAVDDYLEAERERVEKCLREIIDFYLGAQASAERRADPALAHWIAEDCHRAVCRDETHCHEETPWSATVGQRS